MQLLLCFQGKGSCLPYDAGVLHELYSRVPALRMGRTIVAGNSSGSIPAAYFCCFGFSDANVERAEERLKYGNRDAVRGMESVSYKLIKLLRGQRTELPHSELREYVAFALGVSNWKDAGEIEDIVRRSSATPRFPCLIVACNREVLEDKHPDDKSAPGRLKEINLENLLVSWKPEVFAYYQAHPERFRADHPQLKLGKDRHIGRALTFFVDRSMYDLLSQIPDEERIADLRLMTNAEDIALAIVASTSEPTYFDPPVETALNKVFVGADRKVSDIVNSRAYYGGYLLPMPAQDVRRMLPGIRVVGTGWRHMPYVARKFLRDSMLADCEEVAMRHDWWADMEISPDAEIEQHFELHDLSGEEEFAMGVRRARQLLDADNGHAVFVKVPKYHFAAEQAILPASDTTDMFVTDAVASSKALKTMRGLGSLARP